MRSTVPVHIFVAALLAFGCMGRQSRRADLTRGAGTSTDARSAVRIAEDDPPPAVQTKTNTNTDTATKTKTDTKTATATATATDTDPSVTPGVEYDAGGWTGDADQLPSGAKIRLETKP